LYGINDSIADRLLSELNIASKDTAKVRLLNELSHELTKTGNYEQAIQYANQSLELSKTSDLKTGLIESYISLGRINEKQGNYIPALEYYMKAISRLKEIENKDILQRIYNRLGNVYMYLGDYSKSLNYHLKSLTIKEEQNDKKGMAISYNNIGTVYHKQKEFEEAKKYYLKSLEIEEAIDNKKAMASSYNNIGAIYKEQRQLDKALEFYFKSINIYKEFGNRKEIASIYNNIGFIYDMKGDSDKALEFYNKGLDISKEIGSKTGIADSYIQIGKYYNSMWEYKQAVEPLEAALEIGKQVRSLDIIQSSSKELSITYENLQQFKKAYNAFKLYQAANDKIKDEEKIKRFTQLEMQYEFNKKQKEQEFLLKRQRMITIFSIIGLSLMILLAFVIFRSYRRKKKDNQLLEQKNIEIEKQRDIAAAQRDQIGQQKKEITDSIYYASRIQAAILPPDDFMEKILPEHFIFYKPRDIVSGDFYWSYQKNGKIYISAVDCTGHGVPGAFMSMLGVSFLNEIVNKPGINNAADILNELRRYVIMYLHQEEKEGKSKDGMDMAMMIIDTANNRLDFAGAYNPLYHIRDDELHEVKADRMPISIYPVDEPFKNHTIEAKPGDCFYIFSDGFVDQFGGEKISKFKPKNLKKLLLEHHKEPMKTQSKMLDAAFYKWKGTLEQVDDIIIIGVRL
jgi:serine phosphatase RsbU (regulator of sigma subunit)